MTSRSKKASLNVMVMAIYEIVVFICGLILPRLILYAFGSTYNGIVSSVTQFLGLISILRLGIAGSTRVALYGALAKGDNNKISGIINATEAYMQKVGIALLIYILLLAIVYPFISNTGIDHLSSALLIVIIGAGTFAQYFFGITYQTLLSADQCNYIYFFISILQTIINTIIAAILILFGANIFIVKLGSALVFITTPIILRIYVKHKYNLDNKAPKDKSGLKGRWDVMGHSIANIIHSNTDVFVLTVLTNIKIVSVYTVYYLVINGLNKIMTVFTTGLEAAFGNMVAREEMDAVNRNLDIFEFLMYGFVSIVFSCAFVLIIPFVRLYTFGINDVNYIVPTFAYLAVIAMGMQCIRQPYLTIVQAAGHYKQTRNGAFAEAIINISISVCLTFKYGLVGVTIGTLVANTFRTAQYVYYLRNNIIRRKLRKTVESALWLIFNFAIIVTICTKIINAFSISDWGLWLVNGIVCFITATIVTIISAVIFQRWKLTASFNVLHRMLPQSKH